MRILAGLALGLLIVAPALASPPERSLLPVARGELSESAERPRPVARPGPVGAQVGDLLAQELRAAGVPGFIPESALPDIARSFAARSPQATGVSLRPLLRPQAVVQRIQKYRRELALGAVCGDLEIQGKEIGTVQGAGACGVSDAVRVRSISGVKLSQQAVMTCDTAKSLKRWVERGVKPAVGNTGGGVAGLQVAAHYVCRTRNNQRGAKISEHAKGHAIDISAILLKDGDEIDVLRDWHSGPKGRALRTMHKTACGIFGTTLGPGSDGYHENHLHYDVARYRSGSYCR